MLMRIIGAPISTTSPGETRTFSITPDAGEVNSKTLLVASSEANRSPRSTRCPGYTISSTTVTVSSEGPEPIAWTMCTPSSAFEGGIQLISRFNNSAAVVSTR